MKHQGALPSMRLEARLGWSCGVLLAGLLGIAGTAHFSLTHAAGLRDDVSANRMPFVRDLRELGAHAVLSTAALEMYSAALARQANQATYLEASARQIVEVEQELAKVDADARRFDLGPDKVRLEQLRPALARLKAIERRVGLLTETPGASLRSEGLSQLLGEMVELGGSISAQVDEIADSQLQLAEDESEQLREGDRRALGTLWSATAVAALAGVLIAFLVGRSLSRALASVLERLNAIAGGDLTQPELQLDRRDQLGDLGQVTNRVQARLAEILARANETASSLTATAASLAWAAERMQQRFKQQEQQTLEAALVVRAMSLATAESLQHSQSTGESAKKAVATAQGGESAVKALLGSMQSIAEAVSETRADMLPLSEDSQAFGQVVTTLEELDRDTNLLALNIAIEASRPCEQRRGAAVVAEARRMATSTARATSDIAARIRVLQDRTGRVQGQIERDHAAAADGVAATAQLVEAAEQLTAMFQRVEQAIFQTAAIAAEQAAAGEKCNAALTTIQSFGRENLRDLAENTAAISSLRQVASVIGQHVEPFHLAAPLP